jgi:predicted nuclease of predicted toxin-antitoxin system
MKIYQLKSCLLHLYRSFLGRIPRDTEIWQYAKDKKLVIVTKDTDFSDRLMLDFSPPKVVHLRVGNIRKREWEHLIYASE